MNTQLSLQDVLARLADEGLMKPFGAEALPAPSEAVESRGTSMPWFVKLFIGLSAWIAAILMTSFLFLINFIDEESALGFGLVFCALAIALNRLGKAGIFRGQLALALSLTGQVLFILGLGETFDELYVATIFVTIFEALIIWLHRDAVLRFIATLVVVGFLLALIYDWDAYNLLHVLIFVLATSTLYLLLMENRFRLTALGETLLPVGRALTFSFLGILTLALMDDFELDWWITAIILVIPLLYLLVRIASDLGYRLQNRVVIALTVGSVLLLIPSLRMPGILAAIMILVLGFWHNDRGLMALASIFLAFYIWAYYYSLEWTLLVKSLVLLGSGSILLALRYFVVRFTARSGGEL